MASGDWSEEEQRLLEEGLLKAAPICNPREKWQAIARVVGTRDARACAERFRACRAQALERQRSEAQDDGGQEEEDEDEEEGEGGASAEAAQAGATASSSSGSGYGKGQQDWKGSWWSQGWRSNGGGRGGQGSWGWDDGRNWEGNASWGASGENDAQGSAASASDGQAWQSASGQEAAEEDLSGLDERQRRALEMKREVEANRERLRLKQEREESERLRRERKKADEEAAREQERRESREKQERERQEQMEQQRLRKFLQEQEAKAVMAKAAQFNPGFAPTRMVGGREVKPTVRDWAAKANAGVKGHMAKQRKQELLEKQAAEALANIASSKGQAAKKHESSDDEDDEPPPPAPPAARPAAPPPAKAGAPPPAKAPAAKAKASAPPPEPPRKSSKKRWWATLDGDCPISLAPLSELPHPPFGLEAEGSSIVHYFDARFLASFLLSSCDFIDPVNRRPLTRDECGALDRHLKKHYPEVGVEASVADAFTLFERHGTTGASQVHAVQREATAVLQHLFRFGSARRTDQRGRAIAYADAGLTVVDDDDILAAGAPAAPAEPELDRMTPSDFPQLAEGEASAGASGGRGSWGGGRGGRPPGGGGGSAAGGRGSGGGNAFPGLPTSAAAKPKAWGPAAKVGAAAAKAKSAPGRGGKGRGGRGSRADAW